MNAIAQYLSYVHENGINLAPTDPEFERFVLPAEKLVIVCKILEQETIPIIGGDIFVGNDDRKINYAYQVWGSQYHTLNWSCKKFTNENSEDYFQRSIERAVEAVEIAKKFSTRLGGYTYFDLLV